MSQTAPKRAGGRPAIPNRQLVTCYMPESTQADLRYLAKRKGLTMAAAMREALDDWMEKQLREASK